eukprot:5525009-Pyramimonas_sp.AAC.1
MAPYPGASSSLTGAANSSQRRSRRSCVTRSRRNMRSWRRACSCSSNSLGVGAGKAPSRAPFRVTGTEGGGGGGKEATEAGATTGGGGG